MRWIMVASPGGVQGQFGEQRQDAKVPSTGSLADSATSAVPGATFRAGHKALGDGRTIATRTWRDAWPPRHLPSQPPHPPPCPVPAPAPPPWEVPRTTPKPGEGGMVVGEASGMEG